MRGREYVLLGFLAAVWGLSYVFYRVGAPALGPALFVELRVIIAGAVLLAYAAGLGKLKESRVRFRERWREYFVLGALNGALPFTLIAVAELTIPASTASVLNATAPLFSALLAVPLLGHRITVRHSVGILVGIFGVVIVVGAVPFPLTTIVVASAFTVVLAALSYSLGAIYVPRRLPGEDPIDLALGQQLTSMVILIPFAVVEVPTAHFTPGAIESVLGIALLSTTLAYVLYFRILQGSGPTQALTVTFLIPIFGVLWGSILLGEPVGLGLVAGVSIVLVGVALVTNLRLRRRSSTP